MIVANARYYNLNSDILLSSSEKGRWASLTHTLKVWIDLGPTFRVFPFVQTRSDKKGKMGGMVKKLKSLIFPLIAVLALLVSSTVALKLRGYESRQGKIAQETPAAKATEVLEEEAVVKRVIDGDTVVTEKNEHIRLLGINAPELKDPDGEAAKRFLEEKILGETVTLKFDKKDRVDIYGRKLAYIYKGGYFVNGELVHQGLAVTYILHPIEKEAELRNAESIAKAEGRGLWWEAYRRRIDNQK